MVVSSVRTRSAVLFLLLASLAVSLVLVRWSSPRSADPTRTSPAPPEGGPPAHVEPVVSGDEVRGRILKQEVSVATEDTPTLSWSLRVVDEVGAPLSGVDVYRQSKEGCRWLGQTEEGHFELRGEELRNAVVEARLSGFSVEERNLGPEGGEVTIALRISRSLRGRVVGHDGRPAVRGVAVVAQLSGSSIPDAEHYSMLSGQAPPGLSAVTDDQGGFRMDGLARGEVYVFLAGGRGVLSGYHWVQPEEETVEIVTAQVFGARVRFVGVDREGVACRTSGPRHERIEVPGGVLSELNLDSNPRLALLGLCTGASCARDERVLPFVARPHGRVLPDPLDVTFDTHYPGYQPTRTVLRVLPIQAMRLHEVVLQPVVGFGSLKVAWSDSAERTGPRFVPDLELDPRTGGPGIRLTLDQLLATGSQLLEGLPAGEYGAKVVFGPGLVDWVDATGEPLRIEEGRVAELLLEPDAGLGSIEVFLRRRDGEPYHGNLSLDLAVGEPTVLPDGTVNTSGGGSYLFVHGPYELPRVRPGVYTIKVTKPLGAHVDHTPTLIEVRAGECAVVHLESSR